jgi:ribosomal protein S18 acetylase RimI-like enzyme
MTRADIVAYRDPQDRVDVVRFYEEVAALDAAVPPLREQDWERFVHLPQNRMGQDFRLMRTDRGVTGLLMSSLRLNEHEERRHLRILVHPAVRRRGAGRSLLLAALDMDASDDLTLQTLVPNAWTAAEAFYHRMGFREVERELEMALSGPVHPDVGMHAWSVQPEAPRDIAGTLAAIHNAAYAASRGYIRMTSEDMASVLAEGAEIWTARNGGRIVGFCHLELVSTALWVENVAVLPEWQGRGVATSLLRAALAAAAVSNIRLSVSDVNAPARAVYEALGFSIAYCTLRMTAGHAAVRAVLAGG